MIPQVIQLRSAVENTANDLNQIASTLELILSAMYKLEDESGFPLEAISLAFNYGKAKSYRAAKAEGRARA